jgi:ATP-dependent RNA circularization protein (DNA/RNA ligase family)
MSETIIAPPPFAEFASISRLSRDMVVTEKIDGTNAQVHVTETGQVFAGSRNRWITPEADNFGFARWVKEHEDELRDGLGAGSHYGEWWGSGIQRRYGLDEKRFSLFNVSRWTCDFNISGDGSTQCAEVYCCHVVPVLLRYTFDTARIDGILTLLGATGSRAAPGFMKPEGVVVYHAASRTLFKKTLEKNDGHKGSAPTERREPSA